MKKKELMLVILGCIAIVPQIVKLLLYGSGGVEIGFFLMNAVYHAMALYYLKRAVLIVNSLFLLKNAIALIIIIYIGTYEITLFPCTIIACMLVALFHEKRFQVNTIICYTLGPIILIVNAVSSILKQQEVQLSAITMVIYAALTYLEYENTVRKQKVYGYANLFGTIIFFFLTLIVLIQELWIVWFQTMSKDVSHLQTPGILFNSNII